MASKIEPSSPNEPSTPNEPSSPRPSSTDHGYASPSEQPRPLVFVTWRGLLLGPVIHFPALAVTGVMLWINHSSIFWFDEGRLSRLNDTAINNILNSFQLLAKIYELCVLVSLAHITSQAFKRRLISDGLPAGMLTAGYRVGDIFYLVSPRFWSGRKGAMRLAMFLFINTMLAVLTGPASAILIVPKLGYFRIREPFFPGAMPVFLDSPDLHWPDLLDGAVANITECSQEAGNYNIECPGSGFSSLYTWASSWETGGLPDHISFPDHAGRVTRRLHIHSNRTTGAGVFATTPMSVVGSTVSQLQTMIEEQALGKITVHNYKMELATDKTIFPVYQPLVNSKCFVWNETELDSTRRTRAGDDGKMGAAPFFNCFSEDEDDRCHRTSRLLSDQIRDIRVPASNSNADMTYNFTVGTSEDTLNGLPLTSPLFSARLPYTINGRTTPGQRFVVCGALSHWIPTTLTIDPNNKDVLRTNITNLSIFEKNDLGKAGTDRVIQIDDAWLKYVDPRLNISDATESDGSVMVSKRSTRLSLLLDPFLSKQGSPDSPLFLPVAGVSGGTPDEHVKSIFENFLAAVLADAISRTHAVTEPGPLMYLRTDRNASPEDESGSRNLRKFQSDRYLWVRPDGGLNKTWFMAEALKHRKTPQLREIIETKRGTNVSLEFDAYRYGYGFGSSSAQPLGTVAFALCVVYAYLVVLLSYFLLVAIRASPAVGAWGDLHDLVTLAWNSTAPVDMANQGSGVRSKGFLSDTVTIRAVSVGGPVFMGRSKDQAGLLRLDKGEKYL